MTAQQTSVYESKPWLARYRDDYNHGEVTVEFASALDMVRAAVERDPDCEIVRYFDGTLTMRELD
jgi:long-chain acyl-CoA synthetase